MSRNANLLFNRAWVWMGMIEFEPKMVNPTEIEYYIFHSIFFFFYRWSLLMDIGFRVISHLMIRSCLREKRSFINFLRTS